METIKMSGFRKAAAGLGSPILKLRECAGSVVVDTSHATVLSESLCVVSIK
jgi:hypothetical protein